MAEKTTESRFTPKALAERLDHSGDLDLDAIRDQVASALPRRWSEFILRLEQKRFENAAQKGPQAWASGSFNTIMVGPSITTLWSAITSRACGQLQRDLRNTLRMMV